MILANVAGGGGSSEKLDYYMVQNIKISVEIPHSWGIFIIDFLFIL